MMMNSATTATRDHVFELRGTRVMLDMHLAVLFQVENLALREAVRRNFHRFPADFLFELTRDEYEQLGPAFHAQEMDIGAHELPYAFTRLGVGMLASVLDSAVAVELHIHILRALTRPPNLSPGHFACEEDDRGMGLLGSRKPATFRLPSWSAHRNNSPPRVTFPAAIQQGGWHKLGLPP
jgi:hypothetical protein